jgi:GAF domain-containing protein
MSVLRYVQRTREPLVVADATGDDRFARDPYFAGAGCCSLLAAPILSRGTLRAVLLLENRLIRAAFTTGRLETVNLVAGQLAVSLDNAQLYADYRRIAREQAALGRVATLVAQAAPPGEVFAAVTEEAGLLLEVAATILTRYDPDGTETTVGVWSATGSLPATVGTRTRLGGRNVSTLVFQTGRPARIDDYSDASGPVATHARAFSIRASAGAPISVEGRPWGVMIVASTREPLPAGTEARLAGFTDLAAAAIANAQAREELSGFAGEQAALRRVAVMVARGAPPGEVFAAVAEEAGRLLGADFTGVARYDPDGTGTVLGAWSRTGTAVPVPVGTRTGTGRRNAGTLVFQTGRPARIDDYAGATGPTAEVAREWGVRSSVGAPISVEGRLWGTMSVASTRGPLPAGTETRLASFTELAATAIANAQVRTELHSSAEEQAALRRVATLVARAAPPEQVFAAVTEEAGRLLATDLATLARYAPGGSATIAAIWAGSGTTPVDAGALIPYGGRNVTSLVFETGRSARIDSYGDTGGTLGDSIREAGIRASAGVPVSVAGKLWGAIMVSSRSGPLPADTEARLAGFTDLAATAVANAEAQAEVTASRARIVAAGDQARQRIERDLHDGAQQRLVTLALQLRAAQAAVPPQFGRQLGEAVAQATGALEELRKTARGIHPAVLAEGGLRPALNVLARRCPVPVDLRVHAEQRLPEPVEVSAYYVVAEALTNAAKHARASAVTVTAETDTAGAVLRLTVRDNGAGGADFTRGTGLAGLRDRVEALGGRVFVDSPPGAGTTLRAELPLTASDGGVTS